MIFRIIKLPKCSWHSLSPLVDSMRTLVRNTLAFSCSSKLVQTTGAEAYCGDPISGRRLPYSSGIGIVEINFDPIPPVLISIKTQDFAKKFLT